jgi:hypothetical protein
MNEFIKERARLVRSLAYKADPFTQIRLLKLAQRYEGQLGKASAHGAQRGDASPGSALHPNKEPTDRRP